MRHQSLHDDLTGLPNRLLLTDRIEQLLTRDTRRPIQVAVLVAGVDNFTFVNESFGLWGGDALLQRLADRLRSAVPQQAMLARIGGDQFAASIHRLGARADLTCRLHSCSGGDRAHRPARPLGPEARRRTDRDSSSEECVCINVSARQLTQPGFAEEVLGFLKQKNVPIGNWGIRLTETAVAHDPGSVFDNLSEFRSAGTTILLDDVGTGWSSLAQRRALPFDVLKIDRTFISTLESSPRSRALLEGMVSMAHALEMRVLVEGVENGR